MALAPGYRESAPPVGTAGALACVWVRAVPADAEGTPTRVLPDGCVDLIWQRGRGAFVAGPDTTATVVVSAPGAVLVGARFAPGAGGAALGVPLDELRDRRVEASALSPALERELPAELGAEHALRAVAAVAARLVAGARPDRAVQEAARRLADPRVSVASLAPALGLSDRQLRRRCHAAVGYGPKTLARVVRFRRFLAAADRAQADGAPVDLARLAADAGYADQAHLSRDCGRLAGLPPAALVRARRPRSSG